MIIIQRRLPHPAFILRFLSSSIRGMKMEWSGTRRKMVGAEQDFSEREKRQFNYEAMSTFHHEPRERAGIRIERTNEGKSNKRDDDVAKTW